MRQKKKKKNPFSTRKKRKMMDRFFTSARHEELRRRGYSVAEIKRMTKRARPRIRNQSGQKYPYKT